MSKPSFILALDAGHDLATPGKRCLKSLDSKETREWILNDRVTRYQQERARLYEGLIAVRVDDPTGRTEKTLAERVALANAIDADLYLSNHHNAGMNGKPGGGCVAYCSKGSRKSPAWRDALYDAVIAAGGLRGNRQGSPARSIKEGFRTFSKSSESEAACRKHFFDKLRSVDFPGNIRYNSKMRT